MNIVLAGEDREFYRLEEEDGASATLDLFGRDARLLYLQVPEAQRRQGIGSAMLDAAEALAIAKGKPRMFCHFPSSDEAFYGFLSKKGYSFAEQETILSIRTANLISSAGIEKMQRISFDDVITEPFEDMMLFEWEGIVNFLTHFKYYVDVNDYDRFESALSCAAYDEEYRPRAALLASTIGEDLLVEFLMGFSKARPQYVMAVCQAFVRTLRNQELTDTYPRILLLSANTSVIPLLKRLMDKEFGLADAGHVIRAKKELDGEGARPAPVEEPVSVHLWREEAAAESPFQCNINDKHIWMDIR